MESHNCPVASGQMAQLVELVGLVPSLGLASWWGSWCPACGATWQGELEIVPPMSASDCYAQGLRAYGPEAGLN